MFSEEQKTREQRPFLFRPPNEMPKINFSIVHIAKKKIQETLLLCFLREKQKTKEQRSFLFRPPIEMPKGLFGKRFQTTVFSV